MKKQKPVLPSQDKLKRTEMKFALWIEELGKKCPDFEFIQPQFLIALLEPILKNKKLFMKKALSFYRKHGKH